MHNVTYKEKINLDKESWGTFLKKGLALLFGVNWEDTNQSYKKKFFLSCIILVTILKSSSITEVFIYQIRETFLYTVKLLLL